MNQPQVGTLPAHDCVALLLSAGLRPERWRCSARAALFQFASLSAAAVDPPALCGLACSVCVCDEGKVPDMERHHVLRYLNGIARNVATSRMRCRRPHVGISEIRPLSYGDGSANLRD